MKFNFHIIEKLPRRAKEHFAPSEEFVRKAKDRFLAAFDAHYPARHRARSERGAGPRLAFILKAAIGSLAGLAIALGGLSAYADTRNVPADSALYPFKRMSEVLALALAPPAAKVELRTAFTVRRIDEINDLSGREPSSSAIEKLTGDFNASLASSISAADDDHLADGPLATFCDKLFSAIATSSLPIYKNLLRNSHTLDRFEKKCGQDEGVSEGGAHEHGEAAAAATTATTTTTTVTTTTIAVPAGEHHEDKEKKVESAEPTTAATATSDEAGGELRVGNLREYLRDKLRAHGDDDDHGNLDL